MLTDDPAAVSDAIAPPSTQAVQREHIEDVSTFQIVDLGAQAAFTGLANPLRLAKDTMIKANSEVIRLTPTRTPTTQPAVSENPRG